MFLFALVCLSVFVHNYSNEHIFVNLFMWVGPVEVIQFWEKMKVILWMQKHPEKKSNNSKNPCLNDFSLLLPLYSTLL